MSSLIASDMNHSDFMKQFVKAKRSVSQNVCPNRENVRHNRMEREISQECSLPRETLKLRALERACGLEADAWAQDKREPQAGVALGDGKRRVNMPAGASKSVSVLTRTSRHLNVHERSSGPRKA